MSRVAAQPQTRTAAAPPPAVKEVPHEKIAQRAYEKWMKRGCTHGCHAQDWNEAEAELKAESGSGAKHGATTPARR